MLVLHFCNELFCSIQTFFHHFNAGSSTIVGEDVQVFKSNLQQIENTPLVGMVFSDNRPVMFDGFGHLFVKPFFAQIIAVDCF